MTDSWHQYGQARMDWQRSLAGDGDADEHHVLLSALLSPSRTQRCAVNPPLQTRNSLHRSSHVKSHMNSPNIITGSQCSWYQVMIKVQNKSPPQPTINIPCVYGCCKWQGMKFSAWVICTLHRTSVLRFFLSLIIWRSLCKHRVS